MTNLTELKKLAELATPGPWDTNPADAFSNELEVTANNHYISICDAAPYDALFIAAANPQAILQLVELVRLLVPLVEECSGYHSEYDNTLHKQALETFNNWEVK